MDKPNREAIHREESHEAGKYAEGPTQEEQVDALVRKGWRVDAGGGQSGAVYLSRRDRKIRSMTHYVEVEADGTLAGDLEEASKR